VTEADVLKAFPEAESVWLHKNKKGEANGWATVTLRTVEAAAAAAGGAAWDRGIINPHLLAGSGYVLTFMPQPTTQ